MRSFVVVGNLATTTPDVSLEDIPGTSGRLDILCRCINSAFVLSHGIRRDVQVFLVLRGGSAPKTIHLRGRELRHLNPDERTTAALLKKALAPEADGEWRRSTPGIFVRAGDLADLQVFGEGTAYYLREDGIDHRGVLTAGDGTFVLGDHIGLSAEDEAFLEGLDAKTVSVGPRSLHADHCIVLINNELDRRETNDETIDRDGTSKGEDGIEEGLTET
ncbi:MAG: tRNA (pseudouridine(54)-N(1))-methyltransferase TrmY [Methanothrix sp.]